MNIYKLMSGAILETYAVSEIVKSYLNQGKIPRLYFYRDHEQREIDLLIEASGLLYPVEIKKPPQSKRFHLRPSSTCSSST